jgi:hypothetical protein
VKDGFDKEKGFPANIINVFNAFDRALNGFSGAFSVAFQDVINLRTKVIESFDAVFDKFDGPGHAESETFSGRTSKLRSTLDQLTGVDCGYNDELDTVLKVYEGAQSTVDDTRRVVDTIKDQMSTLNDFETMPTDLADQLNDSLSDARETLTDPGESLGIEDTLDDLLKDFNDPNSQLNKDLQDIIDEAEPYFNYFKIAYFALGALVFVMLALFVLSFFTYCCCSRCIASCASCLGPWCCNCCCFFFGLCGSVTCVLVVVIVGVIFNVLDVAIGEAYVSAAGGDALRLADINLSSLSQGVLPTPLAIPAIPLAKASDLTIVKNIREADATKATLLGSSHTSASHW